MKETTTEQLVREYGDMVYRLAYAHTRNRSDADDIFQEVFLHVMESKKEFQNEAHEKASLIRITLNCLKSHWRMAWRKHDVPLDERIIYPEPEDHAVDEALLKLPPKYRTAVHLFYCEGYSATEIAELTGEKPSTVRTRLTRARKKLRDTLKGEFEDGFSEQISQNECCRKTG